MTISKTHGEGREMATTIHQGEIMHRELYDVTNRMAIKNEIHASELWARIQSFLNYDTGIVMCAACENNEVYDDMPDDMPALCIACIDDALMYYVIRNYIDNIGDNDVPLSRAIMLMNNYDNDMRNTHVAYVDVLSSAIDRYAHMPNDELRDHIMRVLSRCNNT